MKVNGNFNKKHASLKIMHCENIKIVVGNHKVQQSCDLLVSPALTKGLPPSDYQYVWYIKRAILFNTWIYM